MYSRRPTASAGLECCSFDPGWPSREADSEEVSTFKPPSRNLQTLRVLCPRDYMDPEMWRALQQYPSEVVKRCTSISFIKAESWRITTEGTEHLMTGYLTYEQSQAVSALQLSGPHGIFLEALARDTPRRAMAQWLPPGEHQGQAYLRAVLAQAQGQPLAFRKGGGTSLGVRITQGSATTSITSSWRVRGVPRAWSGADVVEALVNGADCSETEITSEAYGKRPWLVRTKIKDDDGSLALIIEAGTHRLQLERLQRRHRDTQFTDTARRPPNGNGKGKAREGAPFGAPVCIDDDDEALPNMEVDTGNGAPASGEGATTAPANTEAPAAKERKKSAQGTKRPLSPGARERATKDTWAEEDCGGGGHCFYNCVSAGFIMRTTGASIEDVKKDGTLQAKGKGLRARRAAFIEAHPERYRPYFTPTSSASQGSASQEDREHQPPC